MANTRIISKDIDEILKQEQRTGTPVSLKAFNKALAESSNRLWGTIHRLAIEEINGKQIIDIIKTEVDLFEGEIFFYVHLAKAKSDDIKIKYDYAKAGVLILDYALSTVLEGERDNIKNTKELTKDPSKAEKALEYQCERTTAMALMFQHLENKVTLREFLEVINTCIEQY